MLYEGFCAQLKKHAVQHYVPVLIKVTHNETSGNTTVMTHLFKFYILCKKLFKNLHTFTQLEGLHFVHIN